MSDKVIAIQQADGSFYPLMKEGEPGSQNIELTTVRDEQTTVKVNLYKLTEGSDEEPTYVDTLLIENLNPHKQGEVPLDLHINLDENNMVSAEVKDKETGLASNTTVSLVTLAEHALDSLTDFTMSDETEIFDEPLEEGSLEEPNFEMPDFDDEEPDFEIPDFDDESNVTDDVSRDENLLDNGDFSDDLPDFEFSDDQNELDESINDSLSDAALDSYIEPIETPNPSMLYDEENCRESEKAQKTEKKKRSGLQISMIVCIVCALLCILAVIFLFLIAPIPPKEKAPSVVSSDSDVEIVTTEAPIEEPSKEEMLISEDNIVEDVIVLVEEDTVPEIPPEKEATVESVTYRLRWGDTLWDLSNTYYRTPWQYKFIADHNNIKNPDYIISGTYIDIPAR